MVVEVERLPVETLADAAGRIASAGDLKAALAELARAAAQATRADAAILRVLDEEGALAARGVAPDGSALAAEVAGARAPVARLAAGEASPAAVRAASRAGAAELLALPALAGERIVGSIELIRLAGPFVAADRAAAELVAAQLALVVRMLAPGLAGAGAEQRSRLLAVAGDALAAGGDTRRVAQQSLRAAAEATGACGGAVWWLGAGRPELVASLGPVHAALDRAAELVAAAADAWRPVTVEPDERLPVDAPLVLTMPLGQPAFAALQLFYREGAAPPDADLAALAGFAARTAHALRSGERASDLAAELERTQALLEAVAEAISHLSLAHTLETGVDRISTLLGVDRVGVYLSEGGLLLPAAGRRLAAGHEEVAMRLFEAAEGPLRARSYFQTQARGGGELVLAPVRAALRATQQDRVAAVPLRVRDESIGLLAAYPGARELSESDVSLLTALASQLAVAAQNARLHERATRLGEALGEALESERKASRQVAALYEISRSFAQTLSLDATLQALTETLVQELAVDAGVIRVPDERGAELVPRAVHVADPRLDAAVRTVLDRPQRRSERADRPRLLDLRTVVRLGGAHALLAPFLEQGSTAALLPIAASGELLAELTILSLDPDAPISGETLATAGTIARQAALAIDNARLYQQQKRFAETMQRSLLPHERPAVPGLEVGRVYESAAEVDVGGDVYDFLELDDGRLAVVLGDVTGHGIDATADMAMAKFVFRSIAREHAEPSEFLAHANEVVVGEVALGKFITMAYLTVDPRGEVVCASAGHPRPRLVRPTGVVEAVSCGGIALGIDRDQHYEQMRVPLGEGTAIVLYTDGVVECRSGGEFYGVDRLDAVLARHAAGPAQETADAVLTDCRDFAGGNLSDDCAVVVIRRVPV